MNTTSDFNDLKGAKCPRCATEVTLHVPTKLTDLGYKVLCPNCHLSTPDDLNVRQALVSWDAIVATVTAEGAINAK